MASTGSVEYDRVFSLQIKVCVMECPFYIDVYCHGDGIHHTHLEGLQGYSLIKRGCGQFTLFANSPFTPHEFMQAADLWADLHIVITDRLEDYLIKSKVA